LPTRYSSTVSCGDELMRDLHWSTLSTFAIAA
jgi:hypothetical protein